MLLEFLNGYFQLSLLNNLKCKIRVNWILKKKGLKIGFRKILIFMDKN